MEIYKLIPKAIAEISAIAKTHKNSHQGYMFRSIDDVYNAVNSALSNNSLSLSVNYEFISSEQKEKTKTVLLKGTFKVFAPDGSFLESVTFGEANDTSDKAFNKAMSAAYKYFFFQVFVIPTEEKKDSEFDSIPNPEKKQNVDETKQLADMLKRAGLSDNQIRMFAKEKGIAQGAEGRAEKIKIMLENPEMLNQSIELFIKNQKL